MTDDAIVRKDDARAPSWISPRSSASPAGPTRQQQRQRKRSSYAKRKGIVVPAAKARALLAELARAPTARP